MVGLATSTVPLGLARAEEPVLDSEPRIMREPGERVDVIDAFDDRDPVDVDVGLGFAFSLDRGTLYRDGRPFATWDRSLARLSPKVAVGIFRDVSVGAAMTILLDESLDLDREGAGVSTAAGAPRIALPFRGPSRSGFESIVLEAAAAPLNQMRGAPLSLKVHVHGHLSAFSPRHPCDDSGCPTLVAGELAPDPGTTSGLLGGELTVTIARRFRSFEPWLAVSGRLDLPVEGGLAEVVDAGGTLPKTFSAALGTMIVPWENRESFGRVTVDVGVALEVESSGFRYDVLTDALGTLAWAPVASGAERWDGLAHGGPRIGTRLSTEGLWQASRFVKLGLGASGSYEAPRAVVTGDEFASSRAPAAAWAELARPIESHASFAFDLSSRGVVMF